MYCSMQLLIDWDEHKHRVSMIKLRCMLTKLWYIDNSMLQTETCVKITLRLRLFCKINSHWHWNIPFKYRFLISINLKSHLSIQRRLQQDLFIFYIFVYDNKLTTIEGTKVHWVFAMFSHGEVALCQTFHFKPSFITADSNKDFNKFH